MARSGAAGGNEAERGDESEQNELAHVHVLP
jgi:hypothetical protein